METDRITRSAPGIKQRHPTPRFHLAVVGLFAAFAGACAAGGALERNYISLHPECRGSEVTLVQHPQGVVEVKGCEDSELWLTDGGRFTPAVDNFAFTTECPREQIEWVGLSPVSIGLSGCGHKATYKYVQGVGWAADTASRD